MKRDKEKGVGERDGQQWWVKLHRGESTDDAEDQYQRVNPLMNVKMYARGETMSMILPPILILYK